MMSLLRIHAKDFTHQNYGTGKNKKKGGKLPPSLYVRAVKKIFFAFCVRDLILAVIPRSRFSISRCSQPADKYHFVFFFGFDDHAFDYLSDDSVIVLHRVILESAEDRINIVESELRVLALLLDVYDLLQLLFQIAFFAHEVFDFVFVEGNLDSGFFLYCAFIYHKSMAIKDTDCAIEILMTISSSAPVLDMTWSIFTMVLLTK